MDLKNKIAIWIFFAMFGSFMLYMAFGFISVVTHHEHYEFEIVNNTPYHLDSIWVNTAMDRNFALGPNEVSEKFSFDRGPFSEFFAEARLSVYVLQYSTADSTFSNHLGSATGFSYLRENEVNRIVISSNTLPRNDPYGHFSTSIESGQYEWIGQVRE